jgi:outer membrane lipoprotein-sorting protein
MNDEERTAQLLTRLALETHAPPSAIAAIDRAVGSARAPHRRAVPRFMLPLTASVVAATLVAAVLVTSALLPARVNAADILARAETTAVRGTVAVQSYRGVIKGQNWMGDQGLRAAAASTFEQQVSFAAPNKVRLDITARAPNGAVGRQLLVSDGTNGWIYVPDAKAAQPVPPEFVLQSAPFAASTLGQAIESFSQAFDATQLADETVAGRRALVLQLVPKQGNPMAKQVSKVRLWLDQETLVQLGAEMSDSSGALMMRWQFDSITLGGEIAPDTFVFALPAGVKITQIVPPGAQQPNRDQAWAMVASQVPFQLFRPVCGIDGLEELLPGKADNGLVMLPFRVPNGPAVVLLQQGALASFGPLIGEAVAIGDLKATYSVADGAQFLDFDKGATHLRIQAPQPLPREALIHLAVSLTPVPMPR